MLDYWILIGSILLAVYFFVLHIKLFQTKAKYKVLTASYSITKIESENFRELVEKSPSVILVLNKGSRLIYANHAGADCLGARSADEIIGRPVSDFLLPDSADSLTGRIDVVYANGALKKETYTLNTLTGDRIEYEFSPVLVNYRGEICIQLTGKNVSDRNRLLKELNETKGELQDLFQYINAAFWSEDLLTKGITVSRGTDRIFGKRRFNHSMEGYLLEAVHPSDKPIVENMVSLVKKTPHEAEFRIVREDGEVRWIHSSSTPIHGEKGEPLKVFGMLLDISDSKAVQQELEESREYYRRMQESIEHFSRDLSRVMNTSQLEQQLLREISQVLDIDRASIVEIDDRLNLLRSTGGSVDFHETVLLVYLPSFPIGELKKAGDGFFIKIGETNGKSFVLCLEESKDLKDSQPKRLWLQTISRYVSVLYENLFRIEDLARSLDERMREKSMPKWITRLLFHIAEKETSRLSGDLHDTVLQNQILWYRKLEQLESDPRLPAELAEETMNIKEGMLEVISQIRMTCNNLRPPYLKEQGLVTALESLFSYTKKTDDYEIQFHYSDKKLCLGEMEMISLYRITQELLANARKHSQATVIEFSLSRLGNTVYFAYQDNGIGMDLGAQTDFFKHLGLSGIRKRVDSMDGEVEWYSAAGKGVNMLISIPADGKADRILDF